MPTLNPLVMYTRIFAPGLDKERVELAMAPLVMKFGGTSVADLDRIRNVARHVKREIDAGYEVAVVVSAMAGKTNELIDWCRNAAPLHDAREYDAVVASGEQVTSGLLAIALEDMEEDRVPAARHRRRGLRTRWPGISRAPIA